MINYNTLTEDNSAVDLLALAATGKLVSVDKSTLGSSTRFGFATEDDSAAEARSFDLNGNTFTIVDGLDTIFRLDNVGKLWEMGDLTNYASTIGAFQTGTFNGYYLNAAWAATGSTAYSGADVGSASNQPNIYNQINIGGVGSGFTLDLDKFWVQHGFMSGLLLDWSLNRYKIGDINNPTSQQNGTQIFIDDTNNVIKMFNTGNTANLEVNGVAGVSGTFTPVNSITVVGGIVTAVS